jgi:hypothetical protein
MKKQCSLFIALLVGLSCLGMGTVDRNDLSLVDDFENPPQEAKPWVYWF